MTGVNSQLQVELREEAARLEARNDGQPWGAELPDYVTPEFVATKWRGAARSFPTTSTIRNPSR